MTPDRHDLRSRSVRHRSHSWGCCRPRSPSARHAQSPGTCTTVNSASSAPCSVVTPVPPATLGRSSVTRPLSVSCTTAARLRVAGCRLQVCTPPGSGLPAVLGVGHRAANVAIPSGALLVQSYLPADTSIARKEGNLATPDMLTTPVCRSARLLEWVRALVDAMRRLRRSNRPGPNHRPASSVASQCRRRTSSEQRADAGRWTLPLPTAGSLSRK